MNNEFVWYCIKIRAILGIDAKTTHEELTTSLGPNDPSYRTVARWAKSFHEWREDVKDDLRSGRPISQLIDVIIELIRQVINNDPHSTYADIIAETSLSHGTIEWIIHDCIKMRKVTSRWVLH